MNIDAAFQAYHLANPDVWQLFEQFTMQAINAGLKHYSADAICHVIRWHTSVGYRGGVIGERTETSLRNLKLNNNFTSRYARMFEEAHPGHRGFFRNRVLHHDGKGEVVDVVDSD